MRWTRSLPLVLAAVAALAAAPSSPSKSALPWIEDDFGRALTEAKSKKLPIFVEAWAPWGHSCRWMRAFVFTDKALTQRAGQFVWLSIDTEKAQNAAFVR